MLTALTAPLDRLIANAIISRARRRWPLMRLVPASVLRPVLGPAATTIRREVSRTVLTRVVPTAALLALALVITGGA